MLTGRSVLPSLREFALFKHKSSGQEKVCELALHASTLAFSSKVAG